MEEADQDPRPTLPNDTSHKKRPGRSLAVASLSLIVGGFFGAAAVGVALSLGVSLPFQERIIDRTQPALLKSIQQLSQYHAAVGNFEVILDVEQDVDWVPDFVAGERSLFVAAGSVNAFVDFSGIANGDLALSEDGKSVTIYLPEPQLDKPNLKQEDTYLFSQERGVFNRIADSFSTDDQRKLYTGAEEKITAAAKESDLVAQARANTKVSLTAMFHAMGIKVTFAEPATN